MHYVIIFVIYVGLSYVASTGWKNRGFNQLHGFLLGLFTSPLASYIVCLALKDNKDKVKEEMLEEMHGTLNLFKKQQMNNRLSDNYSEEEGI